VVSKRILIGGSTGLVVAVAAALGVFATGSSSPNGAPLLAAALNVARSEPAGQCVETATNKVGQFTETMDMARTYGDQTTTLLSAAHHLANSQTVLRGSVLYIEGNYYGLQQAFGFSAKAARSEAGKWISVSRSIPAQVVGFDLWNPGITVGTITSTMEMTGHVTETGPSTVDGIAVIGLKGQTNGLGSRLSTEILYVRSSGPPLPVEAKFLPESGSVFSFPITYQFRHWGPMKLLPTPASSTPLQPNWSTQT
jgi:hypothetical protein